jgi:hypothetical protein
MRLVRPTLPLDIANRELPFHLAPLSVSDGIVEYEFKSRPRSAADVFRQLQLADPSEMLFLQAIVTQCGSFPRASTWLAAVVDHFDRADAVHRTEDPSDQYCEPAAQKESEGDLPAAKKKRRAGRKEADDLDPLIPRYVEELRRQWDAGERRNDSAACRVAICNPPEGFTVPAALMENHYNRTLILRGNRAAAKAGIPKTW